MNLSILYNGIFVEMGPNEAPHKILVPNNTMLETTSLSKKQTHTPLLILFGVKFYCFGEFTILY